jgi:uncharacterized phage-associated protein
MAQVSAVDIARIISHRAGDLGAVQLQKLLYYVQAWSLAVTGESAYPEANKAWEMGPVVPSVWHAFRTGGSQAEPVPQQVLPAVAVSPELDGIINLVVAEHSARSGRELSAMSHQEAPWVEARQGLVDSAPSRNSISTDTMRDFYRRHGNLLDMPAWEIRAVGPETFSTAAFAEGDAPEDRAVGDGTDPHEDPLMRSANLMGDVPDYVTAFSVDLPRR